MEYEHIVFISLDTLRSDCVGASPFKLWPQKYRCDIEPKTAALDQLIETSAFFPRCHSAAPYTSASHASIFTGQWPLKHGVYEFFNRQLAVPTVFSFAKKMGYRTVFKVDFPIILGRFLGFDRDIDDYLIEDDEGFLGAIATGGPTVSFAHFGGVHIPYGFHNSVHGGDEYRQRVEQLEAEIDPSFALASDQLVETYLDAADTRLLLRYKRIVQYHYERREFERLFGLYLEGVTYFMRHRFDPFLRRLREFLKNKRHLIVIFGDHGEEYDDDSFGHFNTLSEGVLRVPLIFAGSDVPPGLYGERMRTVDILPTIFDRLGASEALSTCDGASLRNTVWGGEPYPARRNYAQAYTSDTREFVAFTKRLLAEGEKKGSLRHVRYKEAVYDGVDRLVRQGFEYRLEANEWNLRRCLPKLSLERSAAGNYHAIVDEARQDELVRLLRSYNEMPLAASAPAQAAPMSEDIRLQLNNMGYRV